MRLTVLSAIVFSIAATSFSQPGNQSMPAAKRPMTFEDMMQMKRLGDTAVSPDGKWLAYSVTTVDLAKNTKTPELWLQRIKGGDPIKIAVAQPGDSGVQFSPDGKSILFISSRSGDTQQVWIAGFDPETGATSDAVNPPIERLIRSSKTKNPPHYELDEDNARWSPDGKSIVFTAGVYPDCPAITPDNAEGARCTVERDRAAADSKVKALIFTHLLYRHWNHYTGDKRTHLFLMDVASGAMRDLNPGETHDVPPDYPTEPLGCGCAISPDSKELAFTEKLVDDPAVSTNSDIFTLDLTDPAAKPVKVSTSPGGDFSPAYSPDGKYLAWRSQERAGYEADKFRLMLFDRTAKTIKDLLPNFDRWVDEFVWGPMESYSIYFTAENHGTSPIFSIDIDASSREPYDHVWQLTDDGEYSDLRPSNNAAELLASRMGVTQPSEVVALNSKWVGHTLDSTVVAWPKGEPKPEILGTESPLEQRRLTYLNDALLAQLDLPKMESFWFTAKDGTKLEGFLIRPPGFDPAKKYPVKFLIHGGPQGNWGDSWSYRWNAELFAANGYVVVMINPRGSTGYGQAIVDGVNGDWGGKPFTDLMTGLDYAEQHYPFIDKDRECALGASYGGYMANWILGHTNRFKCIVSHDGMFNAESAFGSTEEDWFNIWEFKGHPWDYYGKPDYQNPFRKWSPSLYAKNFKTPTLVVHGQLDYRLDVSEGFQLFDTLQMLGVPSKMLYFPDEGHWVLKPQDSQLWYKTVNGWVDEWTGKSATSH